MYPENFEMWVCEWQEWSADALWMLKLVCKMGTLLGLKMLTDILRMEVILKTSALVIFIISEIKDFHTPHTPSVQAGWWAAHKRWATAPSTQSSTIESSVVHVVDYRPLPPLTVVRGWPAGLHRWCCHTKSECKTRVASHPLLALQTLHEPNERI